MRVRLARLAVLCASLLAFAAPASAQVYTGRVDVTVTDSTGAILPGATIELTGPQNALGQVKILFPNPHSVYLHDTPTRGLFARVRRDFSSGCIRVEGALDLAEWLLAAGNDRSWDRARIDAALAGGAETPLALRPNVSVHLVYLTVVADGEGGVRFIDDLYGRDQAVVEALQRPLRKAG